MIPTSHISISPSTAHQKQHEKPRHAARILTEDVILDRLYQIVQQTKGTYLLSRLKMNDMVDINDHLRQLNAQLVEGEYLIGCADQLTGYETPVFKGKKWSIRSILRKSAFLFHRMMPRISWTAPLYNRLMKYRYKRLSKTEVLGRLAYAGFNIELVEEEGVMIFFKVKKKSDPLEGYSPSFGALIKLNRMVKHGRMVGIYKFRTMHPYAEFIQDYIYEQNNLDVGGKIKADFRISEEGSLFRKYFLDELPMLINLLKGDIKLVGVRPLSNHYFSLYTESMRRKRVQFKPGLLPPYYSEKTKPANIEEVMVSEMRYLIQYEKNPIKTDVKYFFRIANNILYRKLRSK